jgi:hypothetical protein
MKSMVVVETDMAGNFVVDHLILGYQRLVKIWFVVFTSRKLEWCGELFDVGWLNGKNNQSDQKRLLFLVEVVTLTYQRIYT